MKVTNIILARNLHEDLCKMPANTGLGRLARILMNMPRLGLMLTGLALLPACASDPTRHDTGQGPLKVEMGEDVPAACVGAFSTAGSMELISIEPSYPSQSDRSDPEKIHGYTVLGSTRISDRSQRLELLGALAQGIQDNPGMVAACFNPRHVLRTVDPAGTWDLVICFECLTVQIWKDGEKVGNAHPTSEPAAVFNRIFRSHGLTIAPGGA